MGLTQSELARRTDCLQSAISMFESGRGGLSDAKIIEVARVLGLDAGPEREAAFREAGAAQALKFCPAADCPSNIPYVVAGRVCVFVRPVLAPLSEATRCRLCGEVLESRCPNVECDAPVSQGACCERCGSAYVPPVLPRGESPEAYAARRQSEMEALRSLMEFTPMSPQSPRPPAPRAAPHP
jgi:hypothetical protein